MPAGRSAGQADAIRVDLIFVGMCLDPHDALLDVLGHFGERELGDRARPHGKDRVAASAEDIEHLSLLVIVDLAAVGVPRAAGHVDDAQAVALRPRA